MSSVPSPDTAPEVAPHATGVDPIDGAAEALARMDLRRQAIQKRKLEEPLYYADYLQLDKILTAQFPKSKEAGAEAHDEHLFIVIHQVYELWFKQILHEIDSVRRIFMTAPVEERMIGIAVERLNRVREIQTVLLQQVSVLETMSPLDFLDFRDYLYPASGFQSVQFRLVENKLGLPSSARMDYGKRGYCTYLHDKDAGVVAATEAEPSLHALVEAWLERTPFLAIGTFNWWRHYQAAVTHMLNEDERAIRSNARLDPELIEQQVKELDSHREHFASLFDPAKYEASRTRGERRMSYKAMQAALLITLYKDEPILALPYRLLSSLIDIDEQFTAWRYRHALMVHRQLGSKVGTGGSSGYHYLRATAERHKVFVDLINMPTFLIPRAMLPPLPADIQKQLAFQFTDSIIAAASGGSSGSTGVGSSGLAGSGGAASADGSATTAAVSPPSTTGTATSVASTTVAASSPAETLAHAAASGCPHAQAVLGTATSSATTSSSTQAAASGGAGGSASGSS